jgi:hypothetical protein
MNLWIVTIGSSDVQLESIQASQNKGRTEKQRSDKVWSYWYGEELKAEYYDIAFEPKQLFKDKEEAFRIAPRILGAVYKASPVEIQQEIFSYLTFPLLDNFEQELQRLPAPEIIVVILTDQSKVFVEGSQRRQPKSPYWLDTYDLQPILTEYFAVKFPDIIPIWLILDPSGLEQSLDNWNAVLDLVREKLQNLELAGQNVASSPFEHVYVSHQAGTPAISSAVQFMSLATFRENVQFLVSHEVSNQVSMIPQSTYLSAIRLQEAKALLNRYDYSGVRDLLGLTQNREVSPEQKRLKYLLDASVQWNFAKFYKFKDILIKRNLFQLDGFSWWRLGFESAYLAWIRLEQDNPVDAMFHSFRAVEGLAAAWAEQKYTSTSFASKDLGKGLQLKDAICTKFPNMQRWFGSKSGQPKSQVGAFGKTLFALLRETYPEWKSDDHIKLFCAPIDRGVYAGHDIFEKRNILFHRLEGVQKQEVYEAWDTDEAAWEARLLGCLNFIAQEEVPRGFESLKAASLMAQVHQELVTAVTAL